MTGESKARRNYRWQGHIPLELLSADWPAQGSAEYAAEATRQIGYFGDRLAVCEATGDKQVLVQAVLNGLEVAGVPLNEAVRALTALGHKPAQTLTNLYRTAKVTIEIAEQMEAPRGYKTKVFARCAELWNEAKGNKADGYGAHEFGNAYMHWLKNAGEDEKWVGVPSDVQRALREPKRGQKAE